MKHLLCRGANQLSVFFFLTSSYRNTFRSGIQHLNALFNTKNFITYLLRTAEKYAVAHCAPWLTVPHSPLNVKCTCLRDATASSEFYLIRYTLPFLSAISYRYDGEFLKPRTTFPILLRFYCWVFHPILP